MSPRGTDAWEGRSSAMPWIGKAGIARARPQEVALLGDRA